MRSIVSALLVLLIGSPLLAADPVIVIKDVTVIPMTSAKLLLHRDVMVRGNRIEAVTRSRRVPRGSIIVDGRGRFLMPGLVDAHAHLPGHDGTDFELDRYFGLMLARGVTTLRVMRGDAEQLAWKKKVEAGEMLAPHLLVSSPIIWTDSAIAPADVRKLVDEYADAKFDFVKYLGGLDVESYMAMADEASRRKIALYGHVPAVIGLARAIEAGQKDVEHVSPIVAAWHSEPSKVGELFAKMSQRLVYHSGNAFWYSVHFNQRPLDDLNRIAGLSYVPAKIRQEWNDEVAKALADPKAEETRSKWRDEMALYQKLSREMNDAGVPLLVSPSDGAFVVPGFGMLEEMRFFIRAGISPFDTLRAATRSAGQSAGGDFGVIAAGKRADLLLLTKNPLDDIENVAAVDGVMINGRWLDHATLDATLARLKTEP